VTTLDELSDRWEARRAEGERMEMLVPLAKISDVALSELAELRADAQEAVTLREAAQIGGYSVDHLRRLVATGHVSNVGRKHSPRIRRCDVPVKSGRLSSGADRAESDHRRRIVSSVANGTGGSS
jgi:hypothetical protein